MRLADGTLWPMPITLDVPPDVAVELATRTKRRVLFGPETAEEFRWTLVAADGSHGKVVLDDDRFDDGEIAIVGTVEPIDGAPELPRVPESI